MQFHKRILEWQAVHPNVTLVFWAVVLVGVFWPRITS